MSRHHCGEPSCMLRSCHLLCPPSSYSSSHQPERTHLFEHAADVAYRGVLACNCKCGLQPPRWYSVLFFRIRKMAVLDCSSKIFYQSEKDENIYIKKFILRCDKKKIRVSFTYFWNLTVDIYLFIVSAPT